MNKEMIKIKICILGKSGVGKTALFKRLIQKQNYIHNNSEPVTIGAELYNLVYKSDDKKYNLNIWDTAGQERYKSLLPLYYRYADIIILMYDITEYKSWEEIDYWREELENCNDIPIVLVGNKSDIILNMNINVDEIEEYTKINNIPHVLCSVLSGENVDKIIPLVIEKIKEKKNHEKININYELHNSKRNRYGKCC